MAYYLSEVLDDQAGVRALDKSNMRSVLERFPELCEDAIQLGRSVSIPRRVKVNNALTITYIPPERIIVVGMGGSAIGGDLLRDWLRDRSQSPIEVSREYHLPKYAGQGTLVMAVSYSGNTEETLSSYIEAVENGCMTFSVSSGGLLEEFSHSLGLPHTRIPQGYAPRSAVPYLLFPMAAALARLNTINSYEDEALKAIATLRSIREEIHSESKTEINASKRLAVDMRGLIPMVCGYGCFESVATRIKTQFNENSKIPAKAEFFPELNHNETLGWSGSTQLTKNFGVILIRSDEEPAEIRTRIEITRKLVFDERAGRVLEIRAKGTGKLEQMLAAMYVGDFASFYLGILYGIDPAPTPIIDELKTQLEARLSKATELRKRVERLTTA